MKSILLSIRPKYVELIASGEKTIEVRKTAPQEVPFKAYIYCTNGEYSPTNCGKKSISDCLILNRNVVNGQVIGEFICDKVDKYTFSHYEAEYRVTHVEQNAMCLNQPELIRYGKGETLYGFHISDLKIYDRPKELSEFRTPKNPHRIGNSHSWILDGYKKITRPPQSWMHVEDLGEEE